jgi:hypothetical protein
MQLSQYKAFQYVSAILTLAEAIKICETARIENSFTINYFKCALRQVNTAGEYEVFRMVDRRGVE